MRPLQEPRIRTDLRRRKRQTFKDNDFRLATWNVLTMLEAGKMAEVADELISYRVKIAALQEIRWKGKGVLNKKGYSIYYSGGDRSGSRGTGFFVQKSIKESVISFEPIDERMCLLRLKGKFCNITLVSIYAPTEESDEIEKEEFYNKVSGIMNRLNAYDLKIVLGDYNAKVGKEDMVKQVAGLHSLHDNTNDNGHRLCNFATQHKLFISSVSFEHKNIHKHTWRMPGGRGFNQIDHVLVDRRHSSSILDVRSYRKANCDSDHYLVIAKIRQRVARMRKSVEKRVKWDTDKLMKDEKVTSEYCLKLSQRLNRKETNGNIEDNWQVIQKSIKEAATEVIGTKQRKYNEWYDNECKIAIAQKKTARFKMIERNTRQNLWEYKAKRRDTKKLIRKKKREFIISELMRIEELRLQKEAREFYRKIKGHTKEYRAELKLCKDKAGNLITEEEKIIDRWKEHFQEMLNEPHSAIENAMEVHTADNIVTPPSMDETLKALKKLKNGKAGGEDMITAELLKYGDEVLKTKLHKLMMCIWEKEVMPKECSTSLVVPIHKKGDVADCTNYRGISLLPVGYKVFSNILFGRMTEISENILGEFQCGFRRDRSTTDHCFTLSQIFEKFYEFSVDVHCLFIDFKQAFDKIKRGTIENTLIRLGFPIKLIRLLQMTLRNTVSKVLVHGRKSDSFAVNLGVRQGDSLSTLVFNLMLHSVVDEISTKGTLMNKSTQICAYADDIVIMARNVEELKKKFIEMESRAEIIGLEINIEKTKYLVRSNKNRLKQDLLIYKGDREFRFEGVSEFKYLGIIFSADKNTSVAVNDRIIAASKAWGIHRKMLSSKWLSRATKLKIYKTIIRPVLTYGCETWTLNAKDSQQIAVFERRILRKIFGPVIENGAYRHRYNTELDELVNYESVVRFIKAQRISWLGHVARMPDYRVPKILLKKVPEGTRKIGKPRKRWIKAVEEDLEKMKIGNWYRVAQNREEWRGIVEEAKVHPGL